MVAAISFAGALAVAFQRRGTPEAPWAVPVALAAAVPWVLAATGRLVPRWAWVAGVLGATLALILFPVPTDFAPFQLVLLASMGAVLFSVRQSVAVLVGCVAVVPMAEVLGRFEGSLIWVLGISMAWLGGFALRQQERAHVEREARVAAEERQRIARELHDVVAHSLAVTMLHLTGARLALRRDPIEAERALREAEESGRRSMADIRRAVGLLGSTSPAAAMPDARDLVALVDGFRSAGLDVTLHIDGDLDAITAAPGLVLYRITQESLANVARHAPGEQAVVTLTVCDGWAKLVVRNQGASAPTGVGLGLVGMRERALLAGGRLEASEDAGDWLVRAEIPTGAAA